MGRKARTAFRSFVVCLLATAVWAGAPGADPTAPRKISRWESNLSVGRVDTGRYGVVKSVWWYALPRVVALGLSFDWVSETIPFSLNVALNAPLPVVTPFVCAGAGGGLDGCGINSYGGGLKVRLGRGIGVIVEYRKYHYSYNVSRYPPSRATASAGYIGAGIAWIY